MELIFLAAGKSSRIFKKINKHKCLLEINNKPLIEHLIENSRLKQIKNTMIVTGFKSSILKKKLKKFNLKFVNNKDFQKTEMMHSIIMGLKKSKSDVLISYSDIYFNKKVLFNLVKNIDKKNIMLPVLNNWKKIWNIRKKNPKIDGETLLIKKNYLLEIGKKIKNLKEIKYQYMGLIYFPKKYINKIISIYESIENKKGLHASNFLNILLSKNIKIKVLKHKNCHDWYEFDDFQDYENYQKYYNKPK